MWVLLSVISLQAQEQYPIDFEKASKQLDSLLEASEASRLFRSGYVYITHKGKPVYSNGNGWANRDLQEPFTADTRHCIGSVGKAFTAAAVLLLHQRGVLKIHDPINKHLPELEGVDGITIDHLVRHTSGITAATWNIRKLVKVSDTDTVTYEDLVNYFNDLKEKKRRRFSINEEEVYSNFCYRLLGQIVERNTEKGFRDFLAEELFEPLGMSSAVTVDRIYLEPKPGFSYPYLLDKKYEKELPYSYLKNRADYVLPSTLTSSWGVYASAKDLVKIEKLWDSNVIFDSTSLRELRKIKKLENGASGSYSYGFIIGHSKGFSNFFQMSGRLPGYLTMVSYFYNLDLTVVVFANEESLKNRQYPNFKRNLWNFIAGVQNILVKNKQVNIGETGPHRIIIEDTEEESSKP